MDIFVNAQSQVQEASLDVDNEEGFDVLKRPHQKRNRQDLRAGRVTTSDMTQWAIGDTARTAKVIFQDHDDAF